MKGIDVQDLKPVYIHESNYSGDNEISLIDLAMVLYHRKILIVLITIAIIVLGVVFSLLKPNTYTYNTSIEIGSQIIDGDIKPFESTQTLLAKLNYSFIPQALREQRLQNIENKKKHTIKASIPKQSAIIVLETKNTEDREDLMNSLLSKISSAAIQDHQRIYGAVKQNYIASIEQTKTELASLTAKDEEKTEKIQLLNDKLESYKSQLANLKNTREILPPVRSLDPTGTSRKLIVIISAIVGIFIGVFAAFFVELIVKIKEVNLQASADTH